MIGYLLDPAIQVQNENGVTIPGARLYIYNHNTSDLAETYKDFEGTRNTNPVITDALGNCTVIAEDGIAYDVVFKDEQDNLLFSKQNITVTQGGSSSGNVQVAAGYGIEVTPSISAGIQKYEVAIDPTIVETFDSITKYVAGDNIVLNDLPNNEKAINLANEVILSENNYQSKLNTKQNSFTNTSGNKGSIQDAAGFYVSDINQTEFTDISKNYIQIVGPSTASIGKRLYEQNNLLQIDYTDNGNSTYKTLSATPDDVTIWRHRGSGPAEYSLTGACTSAQSALSAIITGNVSANYATSAGSANYATSAGSANYATLAHTAETLPYGRASWNGPDIQGDKIVAIIDKTAYNYGDVIVVFDIYETLAGGAGEAYRGKLCVDLRRNSDPTYVFNVTYNGKKLNQTTMYVKHDADNKVYIIFNKNTNFYVGVKAVVTNATGWQGHDFLSYVTLNDDPAITDTSIYTNITVRESQTVTAPMSGVGAVNIPVYIDNNGDAQECTAVDVTPYSAGANININNHVISGKNWSNDILAATSGKFDTSSFNTYSGAHSADDITPYSAGANINITNHVVSGKDWSSEFTKDPIVLGKDNSAKNTRDPNTSARDEIYGHKNYLDGYQDGIFGLNNTVAGTNIYVLGQNNTMSSPTNGTPVSVCIGNSNTMNECYGTFLIGNNLTGDSASYNRIKIGFGNTYLEINDNGTFYKVVNGTRTQI